MRIHGIILAVLAVMVIILMSSGCVSNSSENQQGLKPITALPSVEFYKSGFQAQTDGNYETALGYYNKSLEADPTYTRAWISKGNVLIQLNRSREAVSAYDSALALDSNVSEIWNMRGEALMNLGMYTEALASFDKALQIAPGSPAAMQNRELSLAKLK